MKCKIKVKLLFGMDSIIMNHIYNNCYNEYVTTVFITLEEMA